MPTLPGFARGEVNIPRVQERDAKGDFPSLCEFLLINDQFRGCRDLRGARSSPVIDWRLVQVIYTLSTLSNGFNP
ncbi:MAG: hypothetical protein RBG13Loki_1342 [Promethearchaeota archaeon CR_4]|nr:MAG: hypothetical protein RBG13Loki_1342 [Candidatus Lokiarchaeota archaeon CR_4]